MKACSFFGHRDFEPTIEIEEKVYAIIENLIVEKGVNDFCLAAEVNLTHFAIILLPTFKGNILR